MCQRVWNQITILIVCIHLSEEGNAEWYEGEVSFQTSLKCLSCFECSEMLPVFGWFGFFCFRKNHNDAN